MKALDILNQGVRMAERLADAEARAEAAEATLTRYRDAHERRGITARCEIVDDPDVDSHVIVRLWYSPRHDGADVPAFEAHVRAPVARAALDGPKETGPAEEERENPRASGLGGASDGPKEEQ